LENFSLQDFLKDESAKNFWKWVEGCLRNSDGLLTVQSDGKGLFFVTVLNNSDLNLSKFDEEKFLPIFYLRNFQEQKLSKMPIQAFKNFIKNDKISSYPPENFQISRVSRPLRLSHHLQNLKVPF